MIAHILFLDDDIERHAQFEQAVLRRPETVRVWAASTAAQAIEILGRVDIAQAVIDHDLCKEDALVLPGAPSKEPTGMVVIDHIIGMEFPPHDVIVHTFNEPAREEMVRRLAGCGRIRRVRAIPFHDLIARLRSR